MKNENNSKNINVNLNDNSSKVNEQMKMNVEEEHKVEEGLGINYLINEMVNIELKPVHYFMKSSQPLDFYIKHNVISDQDLESEDHFMTSSKPKNKFPW